MRILKPDKMRLAAMMLDRNTYFILNQRCKPWDELVENVGEDIAHAIEKSKCGFISVTHKAYGDKHHGITCAFGEGIGCYMSTEDRWFTTSVIQNIDWNKKEFTTLNSVYEFEFEELPVDKLYNYVLNIDKQNGSKNKETEQ